MLAGLPADFEASVLIVQHIEGEFSDGLAEWLGGQCRLPVALATRGATPEPGKVYLAGPGGHLVLSAALQFATQRAEAAELHVPSVNALFRAWRSMRVRAQRSYSTGMGSDGVEGMGELQRRGWLTIAQDEASSVVYGMPRAALEAGAARQSLALQSIAPVLVRHFRRRGK